MRIFPFFFSVISVCKADVNWGVATSAYQVEGATNIDGRTESIWDEFVNRSPSPIADGSTGTRAAESYDMNIMKKDLDWMKAAKIRNYRFSLSWSRLFPSLESLQTNTPNKDGVDYYKELLHELSIRNITPWVTLFHWDLPVYLQVYPYRGWENEEFMIESFTLYAQNVFKLYNKTVNNWFTLNEPFTVCSMGYESGLHAPGIRNEHAAKQAAHTMIRSHISVYKYFHKMKLPGKIGIALNCDYLDGTDSVSQNRANYEMINRLSWFMDPLIYHKYPDELNLYEFNFNSDTLQNYGILMDFIALNTYSAFRISNNGASWNPYPGSIDSASSWLHASAEGMEKLINWIYARYGNAFSSPIEFVISENGFSTSPSDVNEGDTRGEVLSQAKQTINNLSDEYLRTGKNFNITTYFVWSYIDNFEWAAGFTERFGLLSWNEETRERCEKKSVDVLFPNRNPRIYKIC